MTSPRIVTCTFIFPLLALVVAGIYRFNFTNDDIDITLESVDIIPAGTQQRRESIYFSPFDRTWRDEYGECHTCTVENGFSTDGVVGPIAWRGLQLSLKNDLEEPPGKQEVREFFQRQYAEQSGYYPVHISAVNGIFQLIIPVPKELKDIDFLDRRGALLATYEVEKNLEIDRFPRLKPGFLPLQPIGLMQNSKLRNLRKLHNEFC